MADQIEMASTSKTEKHEADLGNDESIINFNALIDALLFVHKFEHPASEVEKPQESPMMEIEVQMEESNWKVLNVLEIFQSWEKENQNYNFMDWNLLEINHYKARFAIDNVSYDNLRKNGMKINYGSKSLTVIVNPRDDDDTVLANALQRACIHNTICPNSCIDW